MASRVSRLSSFLKRDVVSAAWEVVCKALEVTALALGLPLLSDDPVVYTLAVLLPICCGGLTRDAECCKGESSCGD